MNNTKKQFAALSIAGLLAAVFFFVDIGSYAGVWSIFFGTIASALMLRYFQIKHYVWIAAVACIVGSALAVASGVSSVETIRWILAASIYVIIFWVTDLLFNRWKLPMVIKVAVALVFIIAASIAGLYIERLIVRGTI